MSAQDRERSHPAVSQLGRWAPGPWVRHRLGPFERVASHAYRRAFFNVSGFTRMVAAVASDARTVVDLGCGEGTVTEALAQALPSAELVGVDPAAAVGRSFRGPAERVRFVQASPVEYVAGRRDRVDLVVICDVLHHVPVPERVELLQSARDLVSDGGLVIVKDWERRRDLVTYVSWAVERGISGAPVVEYPSMGNLSRLVHDVFGGGVDARMTRIGPWANNVVIIVRAASPD